WDGGASYLRSKFSSLNEMSLEEMELFVAIYLGWDGEHSGPKPDSDWWLRPISFPPAGPGDERRRGGGATSGPGNPTVGDPDGAGFPNVGAGGDEMLHITSAA